MPDLIKVILLAVIQGLTEFLPVSSSGHLGLAEHILGFNQPGVLFEVTVHAGTLLAVLFYYRTRIWRILTDLPRPGSDGRREAALLALAVVPVAVAGLGLRSVIEGLFDSTAFIACMLILTGLILLSLTWARDRSHRVRLPQAVVIGLAQAAAILPGISRSGITIAAARHLGVNPDESAEFSLLLMVPAILGAILLSAGDVAANGLRGLTVPQIAVALAVSASVGYFAIVLLVRTLRSGSFRWFGAYCLAVGALALLAL